MTAVSWFPVPGVRLGTVKAGIKYPDRRDLVVMEVAPESTVAGVFTRNRFQAAPVRVAREHLRSGSPRYLLINTGYANAGTGDTGERNCRGTCGILAREAGCEAGQVLPFSTGVIGEQFPLAAFEKGIPQALQALDEHGWGEAAEGIMTTDTRPKVTSHRVEIDGETVTITGIAKGAGMIKPDMGTMLGFIATDAAVDADLLDRWLHSLADRTFNAITVDGDTSTNDACMLVATGRSRVNIEGQDNTPAADLLYRGLEQVFMELAQALVRDAEGATKFVEVRVEDAASEEDARLVAETIAHSPLVKTALFASDPNWGRILAAVGRAPIAALDVECVQIWLDGIRIVKDGGVSPEYREAEGAAVMAQEDILIRVSLGQGAASARVWTCDFSYDYVRINAEYRT
jgi:glutamate N-acetyltransferase/amino-acid N-acetyltransferase